MAKMIAPSALALMLERQDTCALFDVREHGEYNTAHISGASAVPRRQLEFRLGRLVPFRGTPVIVYDDTGPRAELAATTLEHMGYTNVSVLEGGINRWASEGHEAEWGMNVPSKDFGEKMQVVHDIPEMHPLELQARMSEGENIVLLDSRTPEEHRHSTIPGSRSAPGGELALRIAELAPDPDTMVVVHCAGRTRSITGARVLQRMGGRKIYDLQNGTMGWRMAGLELEYGSQRLELPAPTADGLAGAEAFASAIAEEDGVQYIGVPQLQALTARAGSENVYLIDVRTQAEYAAGHIPGFQWSPGGQAVQRTDDLVAVKNGHVVFACDGRVRATQTASWYRLMGFPNVYALEGGTTAWQAAGEVLAGTAAESGAGGYDEGLTDAFPFGYEAAHNAVTTVSPGELAKRLSSEQPPRMLHVGTSREFSHGHIGGASWITRSWLELQVADAVPSKATAVVVTCRDGLNAMLAGVTLTNLGYQHVCVLDGGTIAWKQAGHPLDSGLSGIAKPPDDVVYMGTDQNWSGAIHYLQWEEELGMKYAPGQTS
ncbi:MAG: rhodanese-related sulfurtransferase [Gammaproteobacteria bacterium]|jgi:rhodanese-related sulfurtransferase